MRKMLDETHPALCREWSPRNEMSPHDVSRGSVVRVWWVCDKGHEWQAFVYNRTLGKTGCPACCGAGTRMLVPGFNDLATTLPDVAKEWHPTKNDFGPDQVTRASKKRVWWICSVCGREWDAVIKNRTSRHTGCPSCRGRKRGLLVSGNAFPQQLLDEWSDKNPLLLTDYSVKSNHMGFWVCDKGHEWQAKIQDRFGKKAGCRRCANNGTSHAEQELFDFVTGVCPQARSHDRTIADGYEYDISVPDKKICIEYNGLYWHSDEFKPKNYHQDKFLAAKESGWRLIYVWEDDWIHRQDIVKRMLERKLGVSHEVRYNARSLNVEEVSFSVAATFLDTHHIQGRAVGAVRLALMDGDVPRAVAVFRHRKGSVYELTRYATDGIVRGGFSRLLKHFVKTYQPSEIVTFSDMSLSDGGLYEKTGFIQDGVLPPDYTYRVQDTRVHKFNYRLKRFRNDPELRFEEGKTERQLAEMNGLHRVYDCGKVRWVWYNKS